MESIRVIMIPKNLTVINGSIGLLTAASTARILPTSPRGVYKDHLASLKKLMNLPGKSRVKI